MAKKALTEKTAEKQVKTAGKPKKLSKLGEWMKAHPKGIGLVIHDMKAVMR